MSDEQQPATSPAEPKHDPGFGDVLLRARLKARGIPATPEALAALRGTETREPRKDREALADAGLASSLSRILDRAGVTPLAGRESLTTPPAALPAGLSAAETRIGWYIPPRHRLDVLESCPAPVASALPAGECRCYGVRHYVPQSRSQELALEAAREWARLAGTGAGVTLALVGNPGTGKSHLLYAAVRAVNLRGVHVFGSHWGELGDRLREAKSYREGDDVTEAKRVRDRLGAARGIALDEIRPTSQTEFDSTELAQLMTRAYGRCQDVIVTSNFSDRKLQEIIGLAAHSRLTQLVVEGPDYRRPSAPQLRAVR